MKTIALLLIACAIATTGIAAQSAPVPDNVPCKIRSKAPGIYPLRMLEQGILRGDATVVVEVDAAGRVIDQLNTAYTHPEFGKEAERIVKEWTYEPARVKGEPVVSVITVNFQFSVEGTAIVEKRLQDVQLEDYTANKYAYFAHGPGTLDHRPYALTPAAPMYPKAWIQEGRRGRITLRFFIDESGRPRVPVIVQGSDDLLGAAAVAAVKDSKFQPPIVAGKPVLAYAEQTFVFDPPNLAKN